MNLILTSRARLLARYGELGLASIAGRAAQLRDGWQRDELTQRAYFVYVDDADSLAPLGVRPIAISGNIPSSAEADNIATLLNSIEGRGHRIEHLLILGGPNVVPFFALDSPLEDVDSIVLTDNPYGARGRDNLVPDRYVGRMPDAEPSDATPLLKALDSAIALHTAPAKQPSVAAVDHTAARLGCLRPFSGSRGDKGLPTGRATPPSGSAVPQDEMGYRATAIVAAEVNQRAFGYAAEIWQNTSRFIYQTVSRVAGGEDLRICPPISATDFQPRWLNNRFLYFNLHGLIDDSSWFGQNVPATPLQGSTYPVALRPQQLRASSDIISALAPFVFSEACYGAYINDKATEQAMCLSFLASGAAAFVGSTVTSYGRPDPPLSEADLLAMLFFEHLYNGQTVGRALVEARRDYARQMLQQQGSLDDDDDKTLLEFVLYGDPTLRAF